MTFLLNPARPINPEPKRSIVVGSGTGAELLTSPSATSKIFFLGGCSFSPDRKSDSLLRYDGHDLKDY